MTRRIPALILRMAVGIGLEIFGGHEALWVFRMGESEIKQCINKEESFSLG